MQYRRGLIKERIHVINGDNEAKYWLESKIELANNYGFSQHELNNIRKIVEQYGDDFKESYHRHIGKRIND